MTVEFLEKHRSTYLSSNDAAYGLGEVLEYIRDAPPVSQSFRPPHLLGPGLSVQSLGHSHLAEDLSERIYAGYYALRRARIHGTRGRIAEMLNRLGLRVRVRRSMVNQWGPYEVYERVKQYEKRQLSLVQRGSGKKATRQRRRDAIIDRWIFSFRQKLALEKHVEA